MNCFLLLSLLFAGALVATAQEEKKAFFLPKNPVAAAYVLGRLSNKELTEAPRSEFVYVALLQRKGLDRKYRVEAIDNLAKLRNTDPLTELLKGIKELDGKGEESVPVLRDLGTMLSQRRKEDLAPKRETLLELSKESQQAVSRQIGFAGVVIADGSPETLWSDVALEKLPDLILSAEWLKPAARAGFEAKVRPLAAKADLPEVQRAAIEVLSGIPGREQESFQQLASLIESNTERAAAISSIERLPKKFWAKEKAQPLLSRLMTDLEKAPASERGEDSFTSAVQFASDLASLLPPDQSAPAQKKLRGLGAAVFLIRTIYEQMLYDKQLIVVEPGKSVQIILQNDDAMPHNLVVIQTGSIEEIGTLAEKMPPEIDARGKMYVPESPKVLHATKLVDGGQRDKITFSAPSDPGDYPYICTFPGHWRRMVGTMVVTKDVDAYLASHAASAEVKLTEWKFEDLAPDLAKAASGRNIAGGKESFAKLACITCHKIGAEGVNFGPDLTDVFKRYKQDRGAVLRQILEPSQVIDDRYRTFEFNLKNGESVTGMVVKEDGTSVSIQSGPSEALIQTLSKGDIKDRVLQPSSLMPMGLLSTLSKDQILDLLAYLENPVPNHQH